MMSKSESKDIDYLLSARAVRDRAKKVYNLCLDDKGLFRVHEDKLVEVADFVIKIIKENYPDLNIPYHTRFNHFTVGGIDRLNALKKQSGKIDELEWARVQLDLVVVSVLLDAGAGDAWSYNESGKMYSRSEGLAVASIQMFKDGAFSGDKKKPFQVDSLSLKKMSADIIALGFQVSEKNPLLGLSGRSGLLKSLGKALEEHPKIFANDETVYRPGFLADYLLSKYKNKKVPAEELLQLVLTGFGSIWPGRIVMNDINLGDVWIHRGLGEGADSFVPFHKLSQWMTYSLLNPLEELGIEIVDLHKLTGLAEYRNGGLMIDSGLIEPKFDFDNRQFAPDSLEIIEWRALTVTLLDRLAELIQKKIERSAKDFPLAKVLEGGTWWAGRRLASEKRGGQPPLQIKSDGTVF